jgi:protein ATS1
MQHTIAGCIGGSVVAMGSNKKNQLRGLGDCSNVVAIGATWNGSYVVVESNGATEADWRIVVSGSSVVPSDIVKDDIGLSEVCYQKLPFDAAAYTLLGIACGSEHVLLHVRRSNGGEADQNEEVWGWGWNEHGNLGTGDTIDVIEPKLIWPPHNNTADTNEKVIRAHAGYGTSWVVVENAHEIWREHAL